MAEYYRRRTCLRSLLTHREQIICKQISGNLSRMKFDRKHLSFCLITSRPPFNYAKGDKKARVRPSVFQLILSCGLFFFYFLFKQSYL